jgi:hypothetical protein
VSAALSTGPRGFTSRKVPAISICHGHGPSSLTHCELQSLLSAREKSTEPGLRTRCRLRFLPVRRSIAPTLYLPALDPQSLAPTATRNPKSFKAKYHFGHTTPTRREPSYTYLTFPSLRRIRLTGYTRQLSCGLDSASLTPESDPHPLLLLPLSPPLLPLPYPSYPLSLATRHTGQNGSSSPTVFSYSSPKLYLPLHRCRRPPDSGSPRYGWTASSTGASSSSISIEAAARYASAFY